MENIHFKSFSDDQTMLAVTGYTYKFKDIFRENCGKFDKDSKTWVIPKNKQNEITRLIRKQASIDEERGREVWQLALKKYKLKFVKKGTKEYEMVKDAFIEIMKLKEEEGDE